MFESTRGPARYAGELVPNRARALRDCVLSLMLFLDMKRHHGAPADCPLYDQSILILNGAPWKSKHPQITMNPGPHPWGVMYANSDLFL